MQDKSSHIVVLTPGFAADESDESCLICLQYYISSLKKVAPEKKISILTFEYPFKRKNYTWNGISVYAMGGKGKKYYWKISTWLKVMRCFSQLNKQHKVTSIQSFWLRECTLIGLLLSKMYSVNFIATLQGQDSQKGNLYHKFFQFFKLRVVSNSQFNAATYFESTGKKCEKVIPFGVDYESLYAVWPLKKQIRSIDIIGIGSLLPVKNYKLFIEIVAELKSVVPNLKVLIIGGGPQEIMLQQKIISLGLTETIEMKGFVESRVEVMQYLNDSKILLHTSSHEGQCFAFMEAYAYGLELVAFDVGYIPNSNKSHVCATKEEMIDTLKKLLAGNLSCEVEKIESMKASAAMFNELLV